MPGAKATQAHEVTAVIVTRTDHDFVDVTVRARPGARVRAAASVVAKSAARKAAYGLAASAAVLATLAGVHQAADHADHAAPVAAVSPAVAGPAVTGPVAGAASVSPAAAGTGRVTTTFHHPFYDETRAAFVDAKDLRPGDVLQTPTGTTEVTSVRLYHTTTVTYDLTIGTLHTYYVEAGSTPVLVHNNNGSIPGACPRLSVPAGKTSAHADDSSFLSGWATKPKVDPNYTRVPPEEVLEVTDEIGAARTPSGFRDHGVDGQYFASHAERQAAVARPNEPIEVDRDMCDDCVDWFKALAKHRGVLKR